MQNDEAIERKLNEILGRVTAIQAQEKKIMKELDDLEVEAKANTDAEEAAVNLLGQLHDLLVAAQNDPVRLQAVISSLGTSKDALAAAIVANTPAAPAP